MPWPEHTIHFVDFEGSVSSGILEYGIVTLRAGEIEATATRLCRATGRVRAEDAAVHGLNEATVARAAPFTDEFERFARLRETGPMAAHFANAENTMLKSVWAYPRAVPDFVRPDRTVTDWGPWVDTGRLLPQLYPALESAKLEDVVRAFELQAELDAGAAEHCPDDRRHYHAALYDALAGALLLRRLAHESAVATQSLGWLLQMSTLDPGKRSALMQDELF